MRSCSLYGLLRFFISENLEFVRYRICECLRTFLNLQYFILAAITIAFNHLDIGSSHLSGFQPYSVLMLPGISQVLLVGVSGVFLAYSQFCLTISSSRYEFERKEKEKKKSVCASSQTSFTCQNRSRGYKTFFKLSLAETKIYPAHKC